MQSSALWYEAQRPGLGGHFLDEVKIAMARLNSAPEQHPAYYRGFRRILTGRFPFKLFYRIEGNEVIVFRVLHAKRDHRLHL